MNESRSCPKGFKVARLFSVPSAVSPGSSSAAGWLGCSSYPTAIPWSENARRPGDGGTIAGAEGTDRASAASSESAVWRGDKTGSLGGPGMGLTSSSREALACAWPTPLRADAKLAAGRAFISAVRTVSRMKS